MAFAALSATCFSEDWSTRYEAVFPATLDLSNDTKTATAQIELLWDERLFEVPTTLFAVGDNKVTTLTGRSGGPGHRNLTVPPGTTSIITGARARKLYPHENVGTPRTSGVTVGGAPIQAFSTTSSPAAPWGVELQAVWEQSAGFAYPSLVRVASVGPNPVPKGTGVMVRTYKAVPALSVDGGRRARGRNGGNDGPSRLYPFSLIGDIPAGTTADLTLVAAGKHTARAASNSQRSVVSVAMSDEHQADARDTGAYSVASVDAPVAGPVLGGA